MKLCELVQLAELAKSFDHYARRGRDQLSPEMRQAIDDGNRVLARDYLAARDWPKLLNDALEAVFERFDAIVTPASPGPAPKGVAWTGSADFNGTWAFRGLPRSGERRVGKECVRTWRSRWTANHRKKNKKCR